MAEYQFFLPVDFQAEIDIIFLGAGDKYVGSFGIIEGVEAIAVGDFDAPVTCRNFDSRTVVEIKGQSLDVGLAGERTGIKNGIRFLCRGACRFDWVRGYRFLHAGFGHLLWMLFAALAVYFAAGCSR